MKRVRKPADGITKAVRTVLVKRIKVKMKSEAIVQRERETTCSSIHVFYSIITMDDKQCRHR